MFHFAFVSCDSFPNHCYNLAWGHCCCLFEVIIILLLPIQGYHCLLVALLAFGYCIFMVFACLWLLVVHGHYLSLVATITTTFRSTGFGCCCHYLSFVTIVIFFFWLSITSFHNKSPLLFFIHSIVVDCHCHHTFVFNMVLVLGCKPGKVDGSLLLVKKITCSHEFFLMYWK
jgi:hypothetical protein